MDSERIEQIAVNTVITEVIKYPCLSSHIQTADKIPSWDGEIYIYKTDKHSKENLSGIIHVQVKGKLSEDLTQESISYPLKVADLVNYQKIQGALLFVVLINPEQTAQKQIYYAHLLPADLQPLLTDIKDMNGTKSIHCVRLSDSHPNLEEVCFNFLLNESRQKGQVSNIMMSLQTAQEKALPMCIYVRSKPQNLLDNLFNTDHYIYAHYQLPDNKNIDIPIATRGHVQSLQRRVILSANNKQITNKASLTLQKNHEMKIAIAPNAIIHINGTNMQINYEEKGSIEERIKTTIMMEQICRATTLEVNGKQVASTTQPDMPKAIILQKRLTFLKDLEKVLVFYGVNQEINFDLLKESCMGTVKALATAISEPNHQITLPQTLPEQLSVQTIQIANLSILVLFIHIKDKVYALENFFNLPQKKFFFSVGTQQIPTSPYIILNTKQYECASNIPLEYVKKDLCSVPFSVAYNRNLNLALLAMLNAYDSCRNPKLFSVIKSVSRYLIKHEPNDIYNIINRAQIICRGKKLCNKDKETLLKIQNEHTDIIIKLGIAILLQQQNIEELYSQLTQKEKDDFDNWPIKHLWKQNEH